MGAPAKAGYSSTLYGILTNPHYVGDTVLGRSMQAIYKGIKSHNVKDKDEWIVFPNTHEAIISREDFQKVQNIILAASDARQTSMQKTEEIRATLVNLFEDKIVCADCGKKMYFHRKRIDKDKRGRWYAYYECSTSVNRRYEHCTSHYTRQDTLEANVLHAIQLQVEAALDYDKLLDKLRGSEGEKNIRDQQNALITSLNLRLNGVPRSGHASTRITPKGFWMKKNTPLPRKATMSNMPTCPAVWMRRCSAGASLLRPCR